MLKLLLYISLFLSLGFANHGALRGSPVEGVVENSRLLSDLGVMQAGGTRATQISEYIPRANNQTRQFTVNYKVDEDARTAEVTYPSGKKVKKHYNDLGQLTQIDVNSTSVYSQNFENLRIKTKTYGNDVVGTPSFEANGLMIGMDYVKGKTSNYKIEYPRNTSNFVEKIKRNSAELFTDITYEEGGQVTKFGADDFTYDTKGNYKLTNFGLLSPMNAYEKDQLGSPIGYDLIGNIRVFQGLEYDSDLKSFYARYRWYNPEMGRFVNRDPVRYDAGDVNLYRFVGNNPVNELDPFGLKEENSTVLLDISMGDFLGTHINVSYVEKYEDCPKCYAKNKVKRCWNLSPNASDGVSGPGGFGASKQFIDDSMSKKMFSHWYMGV
jgi:RHS repeat-associated protein